MTPFTYEGLIAEVVGINYGYIDVSSRVAQTQEDGPEERPRHSEGGRGRGRGRRIQGPHGNRGAPHNGFMNEEGDERVRISLYGAGRLFYVRPGSASWCCCECCH